MKIEIRTVINGRELEAAVKPNQTLLEFLRDDLRLRGSVEGCGVGVCGSCTVLVEGRPVSSCLMLATNIEGKQVTTIEGLAVGDELDPVQQAFLEQSGIPVWVLHSRDDYGYQGIVEQQSAAYRGRGS